VSVYGLGRFPVTLYKEQWTKLLDMADDIRAFTRANETPPQHLADRSGARCVALPGVVARVVLARHVPGEGQLAYRRCVVASHFVVAGTTSISVPL
jgi:hypothetical protein